MVVIAMEWVYFELQKDRLDRFLGMFHVNVLRIPEISVNVLRIR